MENVQFGGQNMTNTNTKMINVLSFQYSYGFSVGERTSMIVTLRCAIECCDKTVKRETSSNVQVDGRHNPNRMVRG